MNIKTDININKYDPSIFCKAHLITNVLHKKSLDICLVALLYFHDPSCIHMASTAATFDRWRSNVTLGCILRLVDGSLHKVNEVQLLNEGKAGTRLYCSPIKPDDLNDNQKRALFVLDLDYDYFNIPKRREVRGVIYV